MTCTGYLAPMRDVAFAKFMRRLQRDLEGLIDHTCHNTIVLIEYWKLLDRNKFEEVKAEVHDVLPRLCLLIWTNRDSTKRSGDEAEKVYDFLTNPISMTRALLEFMGKVESSLNWTKEAFVTMCNVFPICDTCGGLGPTFRMTYSESEPERLRTIKRQRLERKRNAEIEELAIEASI